jgi:hypothetical protein
MQRALAGGLSAHQDAGTRQVSYGITGCDPQSGWPSPPFLVTWKRPLPSAFTVEMFACVPFAVTRVKTIFVPSGDQPGSKQEIDLRSEIAPPHEGVMGSSCSLLPSALTTQIARR